MTEKLTRTELVDELILANEEAEYHAERVCQLEDQLRVTVALLRNWWGIYDRPPTKENKAVCDAIYKATQNELVKIEKAKLL